MKNAKRALLLTLALLLLAMPALAAGKLQVDQENVWEIKTDWSRDVYLFAKITNVGDRDIMINSGVFEVYDAEGQPITSEDYLEAYVDSLKPGEYTYVSMDSDLDDDAPALADYSLSVTGKSSASVETLRLPCTVELRLNETLSWYPSDYMYVTITNNTEQDVYDISIVAALLDQDGNILFLDDESLYSNCALTAGSSVVFRMEIRDSFKTLYETLDPSTLSVDAIAYVNIDKD